jgi:peptide/nickel transport system substrate-binding protein
MKSSICHRLAVCAGSLLVPLVFGHDQARAASDQLVIGQVQFVPNMHPLIQVNNTKRGVIGYSLRPISAYNERGQLVCVMCETLPTIENGLAKLVDGPNGKRMLVTIKLKQGLAWGDGTPVSARDIAFTWRMGTDPKVGFSNYNPWNRADKVDIVDDRTVVLHMPKALPGYNAWDQLIPEHIEGPIYAKHPMLDEYVKQTAYNTAPTTPGLWNGPFVFASYQPGTRIVLEQNPHWPAPKPKLARVVLTYRDNSAALVQNFLAGAIDALPVSPGGISFAQMLDLKKRYPDRFQFHINDGVNLERIALQMSNPILGDARVRKALMHAIDRKAIVDSLFDGLQPKADNLFAPSEPFYERGITIYAYNPAKAKALLTQAGWKPGPDGICQNAQGERLSFEFVTTAGNQTRAQIAQVVQSQLKQVCVESVTKLVALNEFNGQMLRRRAFKGMIMGSIDFPPSASPRIVLGSDMIPGEANSWVGNNFSGFANPKMDAAIAQVESALDDATSKAAWSTIQQVFTEELPMLPLYFYARAYVTAKDVYDFEAGTVDPLSNWAERWRRQ